MFKPNFKISPRTASALATIESCREAIEGLPITTDLLISLKESAKLASTHYSTYIEGNRLTQEEVGEVIVAQAKFPGRKREETEVRNYYVALTEVEIISQTARGLTEKHIQTLHSIVETGKRRVSKYREGQNVIRDSETRDMVYMPPESKDVPTLMKDMVEWVNQTVDEGELPIPIIAALAHYQFVTIHPYFDGNGRTGRLLTTLVLHMNGYGLKGIYALEEYYAVNLPAYYNALSVGESHNYYLGRAEADITDFVDYFCVGMAESFRRVRKKAEEGKSGEAVDQSQLLRMLNPRQRDVLQLFKDSYTITSTDVASLFDIKARSAQKLCKEWVESGFIVIKDPSKKKRLYSLASQFEELISKGSI